MVSKERQSPLRMVIGGFLVATAVPLLVGVVGYGDPWQEAITTAVATGLGVSIAFYIYYYRLTSSRA